MSKTFTVLADSISVGGEFQGKLYSKGNEVVATPYNIADLEQYILNGSVKVTGGENEEVIAHASTIQPLPESLPTEQQIAGYEKLKEDMQGIANRDGIEAKVVEKEDTNFKKR